MRNGKFVNKLNCLRFKLLGYFNPKDQTYINKAFQFAYEHLYPDQIFDKTNLNHQELIITAAKNRKL